MRVTIRNRILPDRYLAFFVAEDGERFRTSISAETYTDLCTRVITPEEHREAERLGIQANLPRPVPELPPGKNWWFYKASGGVATFDTQTGDLDTLGDFYPGDAKCPPVISAGRGKGLLLEDAGDIVSRVGDTLILSDEAERKFLIVEAISDTMPAVIRG